jgi:tRNA threonylcarbamoyladenosine biosynthesis protein TsaB
MILHIDSTDFNNVTFVLTGKRVFKKSYKVDAHKSHLTIQKLEQFLRNSKIKMSDIKKIVVNKGPGSYTGTRVGAAHALALSLALNIPFEALEKLKFDQKLSQIR